jgi:hypothetical protein
LRKQNLSIYDISQTPSREAEPLSPVAISLILAQASQLPRQPEGSGAARHSHVMSYVFEEGLALFAGLNVAPKRSLLTGCSCGVGPEPIEGEDAHTRVFCYANAGVRKQKQNDEILACVDFWKQRTGDCRKNSSSMVSSPPLPTWVA